MSDDLWIILAYGGILAAITAFQWWVWWTVERSSKRSAVALERIADAVAPPSDPHACCVIPFDVGAAIAGLNNKREQFKMGKDGRL